MWLGFALISAALYGIAEILDNFFANKEFKHPLTLVFYSCLFNLVYVPLLILLMHPSLPPLSTLPIFILLGFVNVGYLYPYYKGLKDDDTSVAISFLAIERILVPVLAFLVIGEVLQPVQYAGILVIVMSVILLGLHHSRARFKLSKGVWHISCAALFLACEAILLKVLFDQGVSVETAVTGEAIISLAFGASVAGLAHVRRDIVRSFGLFRKLLPIFLIEELFTLAGLYTESKAISMAPVSIVKGVTMASPFFLVIYAWLGVQFFPKLFKEDLHRRQIFKKLVLFAVLVTGIMLIKGSY